MFPYCQAFDSFNLRRASVSRWRLQRCKVARTVFRAMPNANHRRCEVTAVAVVALTHDLVQKRSFVTVVWESEKDKRLVLPVPFGCAIEE